MKSGSHSFSISLIVVTCESVTIVWYFSNSEEFRLFTRRTVPVPVELTIMSFDLEILVLSYLRKDAGAMNKAFSRDKEPSFWLHFCAMTGISSIKEYTGDFPLCINSDISASLQTFHPLGMSNEW